MSAQISFCRILQMLYKLVDSPVICKTLQMDTTLKSTLQSKTSYQTATDINVMQLIPQLSLKTLFTLTSIFPG